MSRPPVTAARVRGLRYLLGRLAGSGRPARAVFGKVPRDKDADLQAALRYLEELCDWHEGRHAPDVAGESPDG